MAFQVRDKGPPDGLVSKLVKEASFEKRPSECDGANQHQNDARRRRIGRETQTHPLVATTIPQVRALVSQLQLFDIF